MPDQVFVASKWGYTYTAGWRIDADKHEVKDHTAATFRRQLAESRAILGSYLRLYQIHSATLESGVLDDAGVLGGLRNLREAGTQIGLSVTGPRQGETIRKALSLDLFDAVQATWNLLERSTGDALAGAKAAGLRVIVKESLANGRLTARCPRRTAAGAGGSARLYGGRAGPGGRSGAAVGGCRPKRGDDGGTAPVESRGAEIRWDAECERALASIAEEPEPYWSGRRGWRGTDIATGGMFHTP